MSIHDRLGNCEIHLSISINQLFFPYIFETYFCICKPHFKILVDEKSNPIK